MRKEVLEKEVT
jgi:hypothetical protein